MPQGRYRKRLFRPMLKPELRQVPRISDRAAGCFACRARYPDSCGQRPSWLSGIRSIPSSYRAISVRPALSATPEWPGTGCRNIVSPLLRRCSNRSGTLRRCAASGRCVRPTGAGGGFRARSRLVRAPAAWHRRCSACALQLDCPARAGFCSMYAATRRRSGLPAW